VLPEFRTVALPGVVAFVSANARWSPGGRAPTARMRATDGRWLTVDGSRLDDDGTVAVVIQPASAASVLDATLRAYGLTAREREVAGLLHCGHSTKTIAAQLVISPHTVQDHIKAVHAKTGARNRAELIAFLPMTGTR
jgi:DNA-binding CsgD family transcriptional regulator